MPSTFPEAFGMVAAEAAACGALPLSAAHSGLAEVTTTLAGALDADAGAAAVLRARARARSRRSPRSWWRGCRSQPRERERASAALVGPGAPDLRVGERGRGGDRGGRGAPRGPAGARSRRTPFRRGERIVFRAREESIQEPRPGLQRGVDRRRGAPAAAAPTEPDQVNGKNLFAAEVRLLPRAQPRRHEGRAGPGPRRGLRRRAPRRAGRDHRGGRGAAPDRQRAPQQQDARQTS